MGIKKTISHILLNRERLCCLSFYCLVAKEVLNKSVRRTVHQPYHLLIEVVSLNFIA